LEQWFVNCYGHDNPLTGALPGFLCEELWYIYSPLWPAPQQVWQLHRKIMLKCLHACSRFVSPRSQMLGCSALHSKHSLYKFKFNLNHPCGAAYMQSIWPCIALAYA
jgi:hypothetical protein